MACSSATLSAAWPKDSAPLGQQGWSCGRMASSAALTSSTREKTPPPADPAGTSARGAPRFNWLSMMHMAGPQALASGSSPTLPRRSSQDWIPRSLTTTRTRASTDFRRCRGSQASGMTSSARRGPSSARPRTRGSGEPINALPSPLPSPLPLASGGRASPSIGALPPFHSSVTPTKSTVAPKRSASPRETPRPSFRSPRHRTSDVNSAKRASSSFSLSSLTLASPSTPAQWSTESDL
mmetsp:Transcript_8729/g.31468  ORF Transcript_8729/g.31468 Transcript_8729/m.31468 type:complete len:238 (-) Transcript_8729:475-1188(-)